MTSGPASTRRLWEAVERFHSGPVYLEPECREAAAEAGARGFWMGYFATRAAPLGAVGPAAVGAIFFYFAPARVARALPDAWDFTTPQALIDARYRGVETALRRLLGDRFDDGATAEAAALARRAAIAGSTVARPLYAGWSAMPWPQEPAVALWHAATLLREHRSGGHAVALAAAGLDGCESVVSHVAVDEAPHEWIEGEAGWTADEAAAARHRLRDRGWLDGTGRATAAGRAGRAEVEGLTDRLDAAPWLALTGAERERLLELLGPLDACFRPDDQLDWQELYGPNRSTG
ncbi:MAG: hypothetical protein ACFCVK_00875 [Acidimicrobiales bacterium]